MKRFQIWVGFNWVGWWLVGTSSRVKSEDCFSGKLERAVS